MKKKILSILLSAIFVLSLVPSTMVADTIETEPMEPIPAENVYEKFHFYTGDYSYAAIEDSSDLSAAIGSVKATARSEVSRAAGTAAEEEPITVTVEFDSGFRNTPEFQAFSEERYELETQEEVLNFRQRLNSFSKAYHRAEAQVNQQALADLGYETIDHIDYSPFFRLEMNAADIDMDEFVSMASSDNVLHVSFSQDFVVQDDSSPSFFFAEGETSWSGAMEAINASVALDAYDGTGVRIGVFEAEGVCDRSDPSLEGIDITLERSNLSISDHATFVTAIIAQMAPAASYYVSMPLTQDELPTLEWFIDNYCDVVNCSMSMTPKYNHSTPYPDVTEGYVYGLDSVFDYQISYHYFSIVVSAGNLITSQLNRGYNPNATVTSPGNAFNAITVGGLIRTPLDEENLYFSLTHTENACYSNGSTGPVAKPEISAMYEIEVPQLGFDTGTSVAAPQVTAAVALMIDKHSYSTFPELIKSILMATATKTNDYIASIGDLDDRVGAGCLNVWEAIRHASTYYYSFSDQGSSTGQVLTRTVSLTAGRDVRISLAWLVDISSDYNTVYNTSYSISIYAANDLTRPLRSSVLGSNSNVEFIRIRAPYTQDYVIKVTRYGSTYDTKFLALAYEF